MENNLRDRDRNYSTAVDHTGNSNPDKPSGDTIHTDLTDRQRPQPQRKLLSWMRGAARPNQAPTSTSTSITGSVGSIPRDIAPVSHNSSSKWEEIRTQPDPQEKEGEEAAVPISSSISVPSSGKPQPTNPQSTKLPSNQSELDRDRNHSEEKTESEAKPPQPIGFNPFAKRGGGGETKPPAPTAAPQAQSQSDNNKSSPTTVQKPNTGPNVITIRINDRFGTKLSIKTSVTNTIFQVKQIIGPKIGRRPEKVVLMKGGAVLNDSVTVFDYGLSDTVNLDLH